MPTVGEDCSVILDGHGYFVKPGSYRVEIPKVLAATPGQPPVLRQLTWVQGSRSGTSLCSHSPTTSTATAQLILLLPLPSVHACGRPTPRPRPCAFTDRLGTEHSVHTLSLEERVSEAAGILGAAGVGDRGIAGRGVRGVGR